MEEKTTKAVPEWPEGKEESVSQYGLQIPGRTAWSDWNKLSIGFPGMAAQGMQGLGMNRNAFRPRVTAKKIAMLGRNIMRNFFMAGFAFFHPRFSLSRALRIK